MSRQEIKRWMMARLALDILVGQLCDDGNLQDWANRHLTDAEVKIAEDIRADLYNEFSRRSGTLVDEWRENNRDSLLKIETKL